MDTRGGVLPSGRVYSEVVARSEVDATHAVIFEMISSQDMEIF